MKRRLHPSTKKLTGWLDTGGPPDIDLHVVHCERCAESIDALAVPGPSMTQALSAVLQPPSDYRERLAGRIAESLRNRADLGLFMDLMGVSIPTAKMLLGDGPVDSTTGSDNPQ